jgi:hypothetical protein
MLLVWVNWIQTCVQPHCGGDVLGGLAGLLVRLRALADVDLFVVRK